VGDANFALQQVIGFRALCPPGYCIEACFVEEPQQSRPNSPTRFFWEDPPGGPQQHKPRPNEETHPRVSNKGGSEAPQGMSQTQEQAQEQQEEKGAKDKGVKAMAAEGQRGRGHPSPQEQPAEGKCDARLGSAVHRDTETGTKGCQVGHLCESRGTKRKVQQGPSNNPSERKTARAPNDQEKGCEEGVDGREEAGQGCSSSLEHEDPLHKRVSCIWCCPTRSVLILLLYETHK